MTTEYSDKSSSCQGKPILPRLIGGAVLAGITLGISSYASAYFATHPIRFRPKVTPEKYRYPYEDITFQSRDGLTISGWFLPSPGAKAGVVLCHGFPNNRSETLFWARMLHEHGFHMLLFDFRALGNSEGKLCTIGYHEVNDLLGALDYFEQRPEMEGLPIGVFGLSMGGAVSIMTAAQDQRIRVVATHGAYASLDRAIEQHGRFLLGPLRSAYTRSTIYFGRRWFPVEPDQVAPVKVVEKLSPRPLLLMHGRRDLIVHPDDGRLLYESAKPPCKLIYHPRSWHVMVHPDDRRQYQEEFTSFFCNHLITGS
jgi:dipeptidyl aminopeptidase/acylaminoacyl peptidase